MMKTTSLMACILALGSSFGCSSNDSEVGGAGNEQRGSAGDAGASGAVGGSAGTSSSVGGGPASGGSAGTSSSVGGGPASGGSAGTSSSVGGGPAAGGTGGSSSSVGGGPASGGSGGAPTTCGGFSGEFCEADEFCSYQPSDQCGAADATGVCKPRPEDCPTSCEGACGCDGQVYCNACEANAAGVSVTGDDSCNPNGKAEGEVCSTDSECQGSLKCCYPCGIPDCENQCSTPLPNGECPALP